MDDSVTKSVQSKSSEPKSGEPKSFEKSRATRHALSIPIHYRVSGSEEWTSGETVNMSESGVLFCGKELLEVPVLLEIRFQSGQAPLLKTGTRRAEVVRRVLSNWPETRPIFAAKFR